MTTPSERYEIKERRLAAIRRVLTANVPTTSLGATQRALLALLVREGML